MAATVELMGRVGLVRDGRTVDVNGAKPQSVLAVLALSAGRSVATDRIIDLVWDDSPPSSARRSVQSYVAALRRTWGPDAPLASSQNGYVLDIHRGDVDLLAFEDGVTSVLDGDLVGDERADALARELDRWEPPLAGLPEGSRLRELCAPFEELHLQAVEAMAAAQIAGSRARDAARALEAMVREHPTRENLWLQLARALAAIGRRDEALVALQRAREALREHLGVDPSALLTEFESVLLSDQGLSVASEPPPASDEPAPRRARLPEPLLSFVGREAELAELAELVERHRLVTLCGLGGLGKTTLALETASRVAHAFERGACWFDLSGLAPSAVLSESLLDCLGLDQPVGRDPYDHLLEQLGRLELLLVVDNCESRAAEVADLIAGVLRAAPRVTVLATSRRPLSVAGEALYQVGPLKTSDASELFADRARLVRPSFELSETSREAVERICRALDEIPLAIELVAARSNVLAPDQILRHLGERSVKPTAGAAASAAERPTVQGALDWSYELLGEPEQRLFRRLGAFPSSFTLEAIEETCADEGSSLDERLDSLDALASAGLLIFEDDGATARYRLLGTVREYATSRMASSECDEAERRHAAYYWRLATSIAERHLVDYDGALHAVDREIDNFRVAVAWACDHDQPDVAFSITRSLREYFATRVQQREQLRWLLAALDGADDDAESTMLALGDALIAAIVVGDDAAPWLAERVSGSIERAVTPAVRTRLLSSHAAYLSELDPRAADRLLAEATAIARREDVAETIACVNNRLHISRVTGELDSASILADLDALDDTDLVRQFRTRVEIEAAACRGEFEAVLELSARLATGRVQDRLTSLFFRAEACGALGRYEEAVAALDEFDPIARDLLGPFSTTSSDLERATVALRQGVAGAAMPLVTAAGATRDRGERHPIHARIGALAAIALHQLSDDEAAAVVFGHAAEVAERFGLLLRPSIRGLVEDALQNCRTNLGDDRYEALASHGAGISWAEIQQMLPST